MRIDPLGKAEKVRYQQAAGRDIQADSRFVKLQNTRLMQRCSGDLGPAAVSAFQGPHASVGLVHGVKLVQRRCYVVVCGAVLQVVYRLNRSGIQAGFLIARHSGYRQKYHTQHGGSRVVLSQDRVQIAYHRRAMIVAYRISAALLCVTVGVFAGSVAGHGDVTPQAVDTAGLNTIGEEFALENPYRLEGGDQYQLAQNIGASAYNQNCARCHGLEAKSGGIAPDLRLLEDGEFGDEWFMERVRKGYSQNGAYKMPPFETLISQEAMWAIRSYVEMLEKPE